MNYLMHVESITKASHRVATPRRRLAQAANLPYPGGPVNASNQPGHLALGQARPSASWLQPPYNHPTWVPT